MNDRETPLRAGSVTSWANAGAPETATSASATADMARERAYLHPRSSVRTRFIVFFPRMRGDRATGGWLVRQRKLLQRMQGMACECTPCVTRFAYDEPRSQVAVVRARCLISTCQVPVRGDVDNRSCAAVRRTPAIIPDDLTLG